MQGNNLDPGALVLSMSTGAPEPKSLLTWSRMNPASAIPKVKLINFMGSYVVTLG